jgi:hypothetical protein
MREPPALQDPERPFRRADVARYWESHGGRLLHQWWCSWLNQLPGVGPVRELEKYEPWQIMMVERGDRFCPYCFGR